MAPITSINLPSTVHQQRLKQAIRRDVFFLIAGMAAYAIVAYVETHADDIEIRGNFVRSLSQERDMSNCSDSDGNHICSADTKEQVNSNIKCRTGILDAGFILTSSIHRYLSQHRDVNDQLAMLNSMLLTIPLAYVIYITVWKGDFTLSFRLISTHLFRSLCGWFT